MDETSPTKPRATRFIDACWRKPTDCTPVWLMRQAGRYQASYRAVRQNVSFFDLCRSPELAAKVTFNAVDELGVDAAIIFSDILVPVLAMGAEVELTDNGPHLQQPVRDRAAIDALREIDPARDLHYVMDAIGQVNRMLEGQVPVIGFAGAPLTLASYLVEGGHSRNFIALKTLLYCDRPAAHRLMDKLARAVSVHLRAQVEAGCRAIQLFDTWAGILAPQDYREYCLPYVQRIFGELADLGVPRILFGTCTGELLELMGQSGAEVIGIDWRVPLDEARRRLGPDRAFQGNLDPCCIWMPLDQLEQRIASVLEQAGPGPGHIFNLGHGVLPGTPPDHVRFVVDTVHRLTAAARPSTGARE